MKYTKKQIREAFLLWTTKLRLEPDSFMSDEDFKNINVEEAADLNTKELISYIKA